MLVRLLLSTLAVVFLAGAGGSTVFRGVDESTSQLDAALLIWGQRSDNKHLPVKIAVRGIDPAPNEAYYGHLYQLHHMPNEFTSANSAVLKPGAYTLAVFCVTGLKDYYLVREIDVAGGKRYIAYCVGRTPRTMKLVVTEG